MGLFSWKCRRCRLPIATPYSLPGPDYGWLSRAVVLTKSGDVFARGPYDGYGRVAGASIDRNEGIDHAYPWPGGRGLGDPEIYHEACYDVHGPCKRRGPSKHDPSQGGFARALPKRKPPTRAGGES